jgi:hypothetical protein
VANVPPQLFGLCVAVLICGYDPLEGDRPHLVVPVRLMDRPYEQPRGDTCPLPRCHIQVGRATEVPIRDAECAGENPSAATWKPTPKGT